MVHMNVYRVTDIITDFFKHVHLMDWSFVFHCLALDKRWLDAKDPHYTTYGWTIFDHARVQNRRDVIQALSSFNFSSSQLQTPEPAGHQGELQVNNDPIHVPEKSKISSPIGSRI